LPPNLLKLFVARPALPYARPVGKSPNTIRPKPVDGVGPLLAQIRDDTAFSIAEQETRRQIAREEKARRRKESFEKAKASCEPTSIIVFHTPNDNKRARGDPYKTLFISRLSKQATESDVRKEFEAYGNIEYLTVVKDSKGKSRGYCFVVFEREKDMKAAYKDADGVVIRGKKILVDVERGRTVRGWKPLRLGGGLGG
ncbi:RNA-binding domain-containing protein, partial [Clavulina sp. PMI_390]